MFHFLHNKKRKRAKSDKRAQKITQQLSAKLKGKDLQYTLTQSPNARTVRLKINMNNGLEIVVPRNFSINHAPHIVAEHERWILKQLDKMEKRKQRSEQHQLHDGVTITVLDQHHTVKIIPQMKGKKPYVKRVQKLEFADETATVNGHEFHIYCDGSIKHAKTVLENYLRTIAEKYFAKQTAELAQKMGVTFKNITIRAQKTRWGSCTRAKNLNFNWRLILLPLPVAQSVIVHELAHTVHMNHSKTFYTLVERFCPDYRKLQKHLHYPQFLL